MGLRSEEVDIDAGVARGPAGRSLPLRTFAGTSAEAAYASNKRTYSYGAHAAHVAVDPKTGHVELIDYVAVEDVGRIINPMTLHGQAVGAIVQGLGGAFLEHFVYDADGQLLTGSLADYLLPTASDFPHIRAVALEDKPSPNNPLGAKGAGEGGIIPVAGVIANAVAAALGPLGVEPRELPLSRRGSGSWCRPRACSRARSPRPAGAAPRPGPADAQRHDPLDQVRVFDPGMQGGRSKLFHAISGLGLASM